MKQVCPCACASARITSETSYMPPATPCGGAAPCIGRACTSSCRSTRGCSRSVPKISGPPGTSKERSFVYCMFSTSGPWPGVGGGGAAGSFTGGRSDIRWDLSGGLGAGRPGPGHAPAGTPAAAGEAARRDRGRSGHRRRRGRGAGGGGGGGGAAPPPASGLGGGGVRRPPHDLGGRRRGGIAAQPFAVH